MSPSGHCTSSFSYHILDVQARLDAALRADEAGSEDDGVDDVDAPTAKKRRVAVADLFEDDNDVFAGMFLLSSSFSDL